MNVKSSFQWCVARLGEDLNWWVQEVSSKILWDTDGLSAIDPKQITHLQDLLEGLHTYGLSAEMLRAAFYPFKIEKQLSGKRLKLVKAPKPIFDSEEPTFLLPCAPYEEKSPYMDFVDHLIALRVKFLNDTLDVAGKITSEEMEEELKRIHHNEFLEGRALHVFKELSDILEYVPLDFELEGDAIATKEEASGLEEEETAIEEPPAALSKSLNKALLDGRSGDFDEEEDVSSPLPRAKKTGGKISSPLPRAKKTGRKISSLLPRAKKTGGKISSLLPRAKKTGGKISSPLPRAKKTGGKKPRRSK